MFQTEDFAVFGLIFLTIFKDLIEVRPNAVNIQNLLR